MVAMPMARSASVPRFSPSTITLMLPLGSFRFCTTPPPSGAPAVNSTGADQLLATTKALEELITGKQITSILARVDAAAGNHGTVAGYGTFGFGQHLFGDRDRDAAALG